MKDKLYGWTDHINDHQYCDFTILRPRKKDGNYPEKTLKTDLKVFLKIATSLNLEVEEYASECHHYVGIKDQDTLRLFLNKLNDNGFIPRYDLMG